MRLAFIIFFLFSAFFNTVFGQMPSLTTGFSMDEDIIGRYYIPDQKYLDYLENLRSLNERQMKWEIIKSDGPWAKSNGKPRLLKG
ncbi:MAG: hypothetical protein AAFO69_16240, partial [Bacteroidota bacterium]